MNIGSEKDKESIKMLKVCSVITTKSYRSTWKDRAKLRKIETIISTNRPVGTARGVVQLHNAAIHISNEKAKREKVADINYLSSQLYWL